MHKEPLYTQTRDDFTKTGSGQTWERNRHGNGTDMGTEQTWECKVERQAFVFGFLQVLTAALNRDVAHWRQEQNCCRSWNLATQVRYAKGWIRARLSHLSDEVPSQLADCARRRDCTAPQSTEPLTCTMSEAGLVQAQCDANGVAAPTVCEQGSVGTRCVHNDDLCAPNDGAGPCANGGAETTSVFAMPFSVEETDPLPRQARDKPKDKLTEKTQTNNMWRFSPSSCRELLS